MPPELHFDLAQIDFTKVVGDAEAIRKVNPQRFEMEQLDAVVYLDPVNKILIGYKDIRYDEFWVRGHMPGYPLLPGVLMCEAIAQVGAIAVLTDPRFAGKLPLFGGLDGARFRRQVGPGDTLELHVELQRMSARAGKGRGSALLRGETACECDLMFVLVDR